MTYHLIVADAAYSSWSLRGWLLFEKFSIPVEVTWTRLYDDGFKASLADWAPAKSVPAVKDAAGAVWSDSLAIAEGLAERHPEAGFWPQDPAQRALARSITSEMHTGFMALRGECPMNLRMAWPSFDVSDAVKADLARLEHLWSMARNMAGEGPWLFGDYSIADVFYAPVAARIACYGLPMYEAAQAYVMTHLRDAAFQKWRAIGEAQDRTLSVYPHPDTPAPWPV